MKSAPEFTPRERLLSALRREPVQAQLPHMEIEFHLCREAMGEDPLTSEAYEGLPEYAKMHTLARNADLWIQIARKFDQCAITSSHVFTDEVQLQVYEMVRELSDDMYALTASVDAAPSLNASDTFQSALRSIQTLVRGGADIVIINVGSVGAVGGEISPEEFTKSVAPVIAGQVRASHDEGALTIVHMHGDIWPVMDDILASETDALHGFDWAADVDIRNVRNAVGEEFCLIGGVDCLLLAAGDREAIEANAQYCLEHGPVNDTGFVYSSSHGIFPDISIDSYRVMMDAKTQWEGRRPLSAWRASAH